MVCPVHEKGKIRGAAEVRNFLNRTLYCWPYSSGIKIPIGGPIGFGIFLILPVSQAKLTKFYKMKLYGVFCLMLSVAYLFRYFDIR